MTRPRSAVGAVLFALAAVALPGLVVPVPAAAAPGPDSAPQYYFDDWDVPAIWASGARGQGVVIAELDTGVNASLPELSANVLPGLDLGTAGGDGRVDRDTDAFGHGTAMASLMVAHPGTYDVTGLAPDAQVLPVAIPLRGTSDEADDDRLPQAIRAAVDGGAKIVSMSLGGTRAPRTDSVPCDAAEQEAVFYALDKGAVLVAASGNGGQDGSPVTDPGVCLGVVSVGAVDADGDVASFSSRHPYLTMTAPGVAIASLSRIAGTAYDGDGTSQATAITAAALALAWSAHPELTNEQLIARLLASLRPGQGQTAGTHSEGYGYGMLAADRLVADPAPADAPNPVVTDAAPFRARYRAGLDASAVQGGVTPPAGTGGGGTVAADPPTRLDRTFWLALAAVGAGVVLVVVALLRRRRAGRPAPPVGVLSAPGQDGVRGWPDPPVLPDPPVPFEEPHR